MQLDSTHAAVRSLSPVVREPSLQFLVQWENPAWAFFTNFLAMIRKEPELQFASSDDILSQCFVDSPFPKRGMFDSALGHAFAVVAIWGITMAWNPPHVEFRDPMSDSRLTYYVVSEYLPEVNSDATVSDALRQRARRSEEDRAADPAWARQEIISLPPEPDNRSQTIITDNPMRIDRDIPLPNIAAAMPALVQPLEVRSADRMAAEEVAPPKLTVPREILQLHTNASMPALAPQPVEVANGPTFLKKREEIAAPKLTANAGLPMPVSGTAAMPTLAQQPIAVAQGRSMRQKPQADPAAPTISAKPGLPQVAGRPASMPSLRPSVQTQSATASATIPSQPVPLPTSPTVAAKNSTLLALSANPAPAHGPVSVPSGTRLGEFVAGPTGIPGATGSVAKSRTAQTDTPGGGLSSSGDSRLAGIHVSPGPTPTTNAPVVVSGGPRTPDDAREKLLAAARPNANLPPPRVEPSAPDKSNEYERKVFGAKRYYTLTINMPNLNSSTGSWIIRFAELRPTPGGQLAAPVATSKADPAYPPDLIRDKIEGTVVLYAVIRADGSIGDVRVLSSVEDRLDANAIKALQRWHFEPGAKDGKPVDVEAVVQIPFKVKKLSF